RTAEGFSGGDGSIMGACNRGDRGRIMTHTPLADVLRHVRTLAAAAPPEGSDSDLLRRFAAGNDPHAFAALVRRHGPLLLRVCRRVLRHEQDAEDAFQATFLVLAKKAASLCSAASLVGWLHGVAYRTALDARRAASRRRAREGRARTPSPPDPAWEAA